MTSETKRGPYIVFDGLDGSGKGTVLKAVEARYPFLHSDAAQSVDFAAIYTREPGGTPLAEKIRSLLLSKENYMDGVTEFFLFLAQRRDVRKQLIEPALKRGETVISDRSDSSTFAFQINGRQLSEMENLFWATMPFLEPRPDLYIILDLPAEVAAKRMGGREATGEVATRIDMETIDFHQRVREGFRSLGTKPGVRCEYIDATPPADVVAAQTLLLLQKFLEEWYA